MAQSNTSRGIQLIRTDDAVAGVVKFYDRRQSEASKAFIAEVDVSKLPREALIRAARHGLTQNILDASNKLSGDERVAFIRNACKLVQDGGWASAPVDEGALRERAIDALMKLGLNRAAAEAAANAAKK